MRHDSKPDVITTKIAEDRRLRRPTRVCCDVCGCIPMDGYVHVSNGKTCVVTLFERLDSAWDMLRRWKTST